MLLDDQDAWHVGPVDEKGDGLGGLHNVSVSTINPGCLWISLQFCNEVMLVEAATMKIRHIFKVRRPPASSQPCRNINVRLNYRQN